MMALRMLMMTKLTILVIFKMMVTRTCPLAIDFLLNRAEVRGWKTNVFPVYNRDQELEDGDDNDMVSNIK